MLHVGAKSAKKGRRDAEDACALAFGETRRNERLGDTERFWKSMEKRLPVALRALARFKSVKKGRCDAEDAAYEIRRETGEKPLNSI